MSDYCYFFFSYASANHANAEWDRHGNRGNYLDGFYETLCKQVSNLTGWPANQVAYRDRQRLKMSDFWNQELVKGLQKSRVLLSLISPHYLRSHNCGRELAFFNRRLDEYVQANGAGEMQAHRILPLFWEDSPVCMKKTTPGLSKFLNRCNFTQQGMPASYPAVGISQLCMLRAGNDYEQLCRSIAERIVELADEIPPLPPLPEQEDFSDLESIYRQLEKEAETYEILNGPGGANVVYVVGTRSEMEASGGMNLDSYAEKREGWLPFSEAPGATIELLTQEGVNQAGLNELHNARLPNNLVRLIEEAKQKNSAILLVFDRWALRVPHITAKMSEYDQHNFTNCGLVTAGGSEIPDDQIGKIFRTKSLPNYPHHIWNIPMKRDIY
jgi:hypothetical protein